MTTRINPPFRADHVGSLLRPRALKDAGRALRDGASTQSDYDEVLEAEIARVVALQENVGLQSITDGEFGRSSWFGFFFERLQGFSIGPSAYKFHDTEGNDYEWMTCYASDKMQRTQAICVDEFQRVRSLTTQTPKATMPSPSALHFFRGDQCRDPAVYPDLEGWWDEVVSIYRAEIGELAAAGCTYLQIDEVPLAMLCDASVRDQAKASGMAVDHLIEKYVGVVNRSLASRPAGMTVAMHLCRGNFRSRWMASGGYEPIAEHLFGELNVDALFLEYDSDRAGDFRPLRFIPDEKVVVLGLVTTKSPALEDESDLKQRIDEAVNYVPLDRLALSPQCGFASVAGGNELTEAEEVKKLELIVRVARDVWGA